MYSTTHDADPPSGPKHRLLLLILLAIAISAFVVRALRLGIPALELDELWNAELSTGRGSVHEQISPDVIRFPEPSTSLAGAPPPWNIPWTLDSVTHPPLFSIVLRCWRNAGLYGDFGMRMLGAILSSVAIIPLGLAVAALNGRVAAIWTALLMALATTPIVIAQQIRPYNLLLFFECLAIWQAVRMRRDGVSWIGAAALALTSFAAAWTHYFSVPMLAAIVLPTMFHLNRRSNLRLVSCLLLAGVLYAAIWTPAFLRQRQSLNSAAGVWMRQTSTTPARETLSELAHAPMRLLSMPRYRDSTAIVAGIAIISACIAMALRNSESRFWFSILLGTLGFLVLVDLTQQTRMLGWPRYALQACPALFAMISSLAEVRALGKLRFAVPSAALVAAIVGLPHAFETNHPDYREFARFLDQHVHADDIVVFPVNHDWSADAGIQYAMWSHYSSIAARRVLLLTQPAGERILSELRSARAVWVVTHPSEKDPLALLPEARQATGAAYSGAYTSNVIGVDMNTASNDLHRLDHRQ